MARRLRVLMSADPVGGVFSYAATLARALSARGVEIVLATMGARLHDDQRRELMQLDRVLLCESTFALEWMDEPWRDVDAAGQWLLDLERDLEPDVVHLNGYAHAALPFRAPRVLVAHSSVGSWWRAVLGEAAPARYAEYRRRLLLGLARAERVVAPTRAMLDALCACEGYGGGGVVIANAAEPPLAPAVAKEPFVLAAGRLWDGAKNLELLARAARDLAWPVRVAGETRDAAVPAGVELLGRLPRGELAAWMQRASVFVHPARYEPFGLAPLEAALAGCALVLGDIASLREVWGDAAAYVAPDDRDGLVRALRSLERDGAALSGQARRARARAARYDVTRMVESYLAVYRELGARDRTSRLERAS